MPGGRGGRRKGTPGKSYAQRTDLATDYAPTTPQASPATGGVAPSPVAAPPVFPEDVPKLDDVTARPGEHVLTGLSSPGAPSSTAMFGPQAGDPVLDELRRAYQAYPTAQLANVIRVMMSK